MARSDDRPGAHPAAAWLAAALALVLAAPSAGAREALPAASAFDCPVPADEASISLPGDVRVLAVEQAQGGDAIARLLVRGGRAVTVRAGHPLGGGRVEEIRFDEALVVLRAPLADPRLLRPYRDDALRQAGVVPAAWLGVEGEKACPTAVVRVEPGGVVVRAPPAGRRRAELRRLAPGDVLCAGWRVARVAPQGGAPGERGVVVLAEEASGRRVALAGLWP
jgi:hypothetical protein